MGFIYVNNPSDIPEAVKAHKLDRRYKYSLFDNMLVYSTKFTGPCTGCSEHEENTAGPDIGSGCQECGYTGKRVSYYPCMAHALDGVKEFALQVQ